ncbi:saccharopine dehydrogenase [Rhodosalinus halophilus]|uniref:Saccharopine dehydrogenase n=1 Tax=Rhodosalinus halophilus TaxID=2259333 RepID=A0A365UCT3_9RHOB|nr:saccharopine dehydrogenase NADP-binding domain-containing protein [Rhodosalinus halophilus]RBI86428.1 saccharopine dehydrogenase [Rhodosalinus halophilus]
MTPMIYGAYGFTGRLIAEEAVRRGLRPVLAGRDADKLAALADRLGLPHRAVALDDPAGLRAALEGCGAVIHAAGPFADTSAPMADACIATRTHYLDITGEPGVFAALRALGPRAEAAGVALLPGCGFDVVPTDGLAAMVARRCRGAQRLTLAFAGIDTPSRGTLRTAARNLDASALVRRAGRIERRRGGLSATLDFGDGPTRVVATTWGDLETAWDSTGIPDIEVFMAPAPGTAALFRLPGPLRRLVARAALSERGLARRPEGPDARTRRTARARVYARAEGPGGVAEQRLEVCEPYAFTARSAVEIACRVVAGAARPGYRTPSQAFGEGLVLDIAGTRLLE